MERGQQGGPKLPSFAPKTLVVDFMRIYGIISIERERERRYMEPLHKKQNPYEITQEVIDKIPCVGIIDGEGPIDKCLQKLHKEVLRIARDENDGNEVGILLDLESGKYEVIKGTASYIELGSSDKAVEMLNCGDDNLALLHNHPLNTHFSIRDIRTFLAESAVHTITVIGHKGAIYALTKAGVKLVDTIAYSQEIEDASTFLKNCKQFGIEYRHYEEGINT